MKDDAYRTEQKPEPIPQEKLFKSAFNLVKECWRYLFGFIITGVNVLIGNMLLVLLINAILSPISIAINGLVYFIGGLSALAIGVGVISILNCILLLVLFILGAIQRDNIHSPSTLENLATGYLEIKRDENGRIEWR